MSRARAVLYLMSRTVLLVVGLLVTGNGAAALYAQSGPGDGGPASRANWRLMVDGTEADWPEEIRPSSVDSVQAVAERVLRHVRRDGYYYARLDSAILDTSAGPPQVQVHLDRGPQVMVERLRITGANALSPAEVRRLVSAEAGAPFNPERFEADVEALLDRYEDMGRPLAQIRVQQTLVDTTAPPRLRLTLAIDEGNELWLKGIEVPDNARTSPGLVARLAELRVGAPLTNYDPDAIQSSLQESPFFSSVGTPEMQVGADGGAVLQVPVEETSPGTFNLVVGYLPPSQAGGGQLVGSGALALKHLFGGGRRADLMLDRRPGQTSIFDVEVSDPYVFGLPFRLTGAFRGEQRDSTYGKRAFELRAGYQFVRSFALTGRLSREVVDPGQAGTQLVDGRQRISRSRTLFYGVGVQYETIDHPANPRHGVRLQVTVDRGRKKRTFQRVTASNDTTRERESLPQERLQGEVRGFLPLFDRQVLVLGGDGAVLRSQSYDRSDLFRFGGAQSLRGYDEDRFLGNVTVRGLLEYRLQLGRRSYVYGFGDLGYAERPSLGNTPALQAWHPGYGLGLQISTAIGLIRATYALNPEVSTPADGRIHFGLSVEL